MSISLDLLKNQERRRYTELAIFPEDVVIPSSTVATLWGLDDFDTEELAVRLGRLSLLRHDLPGQTVRLHDTIRSYLDRQLTDRPALHTRLIDGWGDLHHLPDGYAWRWAGYHLLAAGRTSQLRDLLLDYGWLQARIAHVGANAVSDDSDRLVASVSRDKPPVDAVWKLGRALRQAAHILANAPEQLASQLWGRLLGDPSPELRALLEQAAHSQSGPWLRPLTPSLSEPTSLLRTLIGHTAWVRAVAVTPDGRRVASGASDNTLRVWDLASGIELRRLEGHSDEVMAVAMTPDGRRAVSGSRDHTLRVWDLESGIELHRLEGHSGDVMAVAMTPDGQRAVSGASDSTLRVWDLESGIELRCLKGHTNYVN